MAYLEGMTGIDFYNENLDDSSCIANSVLFERLKELEEKNTLLVAYHYRLKDTPCSPTPFVMTNNDKYYTIKGINFVAHIFESIEVIPKTMKNINKSKGEKTV